MTLLPPTAVGTPLPRVEGRDKVTGRARYAYEHPVDGVAYGWVVGSTVASGRVRGIDVGAALAEPGVLGVVWHGNARRLRQVRDPELMVLQCPDVSYYGQVVAVVVATSLETARAAARALQVDIDQHPHHSLLSPDDPDLFTPDRLNAGFPAETSDGDVETALAGAAFAVDEVYETPYLHNQPMEPHAAVAQWSDDGDSRHGHYDGSDRSDTSQGSQGSQGSHGSPRLTLWDTTQNPSELARTTARLFGLPDGGVVVHSEHVGGGFGGKGTARPHSVLAALAALAVGRPVKLALTREMTFHMVGYRTPTRQRVRLGADQGGRLVAIAHHTVEQTSRLLDFAEQTGESTRHMYAAPNRLVTHQLARLDVPTPRWMRAPGEAPGMYAVESALDELAVATGIDPVELRIRNEPATDPDSGRALSSRHYVECLLDGARRFGWGGPPVDRRMGPWLVGRGVAGSLYPVYQQPSTARAEALDDGSFDVAIAAADIGTGARTALRQIAADALGVPVEQVRMRLGSSSLPRASGAGGSAGTASWGRAVTKACQALREQLDRRGPGPHPSAVGNSAVPPSGPSGLVATADTTADVKALADLARFAFGAQFVEVRVHVDTGEVRVPRALGVFAVGRVVNPRLARSQLIGGMTMGLAMGMLEEGVVDLAFGDTMNDDLAGYHIAANADVHEVEAVWLDEADDDLNPMGSKGIGEIGIVGTAAAVTNAVYDATGVRIRDLPVRLDKLPARRWHHRT